MKTKERQRKYLVLKFRYINITFIYKIVDEFTNQNLFFRVSRQLNSTPYLNLQLLNFIDLFI